MITREDVRELAEFKCNQAEDCALSFYFQPQTPQNKSHREESILAKDLVRAALAEAEKDGRNRHARADLKRILSLAESLHGNQARAKAVFACSSRNIWREFDLPAQLPGTQLLVNSRFHLRPLAVLLGEQLRLWVTLIDRHKARIFELTLNELKEHEGLFQNLPRTIREDGFRGYDSDHVQRRISDEALHHFKAVAQYLKEALDREAFDNLLIGCNESLWHKIETQLHPYVKERVLGHFAADTAKATLEQVHEQSTQLLHESSERRAHDVVREVLREAQGNSRGVTGLRRVLRSLEMGEVQTLLMGEDYQARAVECVACGHLDAHMVRHCPLCGRDTREIEDVADAIIPAAIRRDVNLFYIKGDSALDRVGNIAALLRFRNDQSRSVPARRMARSML